MIKTIFFDFGGVISGNHNSWDGMHKRIKDETGLTAEELDTLFHRHWQDISINKKVILTFLKMSQLMQKNRLPQSSYCKGLMRIP